MKFKLDTGAEVTAICPHTFKSLKRVTLTKPQKVLYGPGRRPLQVIGQFQEVLSYNEKSSEQRIYVVKGLRTNLLGLPAITSLNLAARVYDIGSHRQSFMKAYPKVFQGLGNFGEPYDIKLKPNAQPYCLYTPRRVLLPFRGKVKAELNRMESLGVISKVEVPTSWCAGMVAVPKKSGAIRICVDLKPLMSVS